MRSLPWTLAWARLRKYPLRTFSIAVSVTLALITLLSLQGISYSTSNSLVSYSLAQLPPGDRTLTITSSQIINSKDQLDVLGTYLPEHLSGLIAGGLTREFLYTQVSDPHGVGFHLAGIDNLAGSVTLNSGRLPKICTPTLCEVLQIGGAKNSAPRPATFGLVIVGTGNLRDSQLFTGAMAVTDGAPILLLDGVPLAGSLKYFSTLQGSDAWVAQMNLARIAKTGANEYINSILAFENQLSIDHSEVNITWPQDALGTANDQSTNISDKFILLDFVVGALLVAFLILFSLRYRREHVQFRAGLSRIGTPKKTLALELIIEYAAPLALGLLLSFFFSLFVPTALSQFNFHANLGHVYHGWERYLVLIFACLFLTIGSAIVGDKAWRRQTWIPFILGLILVSDYLLQSGVHVKRFLLLPFGYTLIPALIGYLLLRVLSTLWSRKSSHTYVLFRENLSMWQGVAAILTLASILAMIALSFDSGVSQKVIREATDQVPLDISLRTGPALIRPLDLGGTGAYEKLLKGTNAYPILRAGTGIRNQNVVSDTLTLLGLPPSAMKKMSNAAIGKLASIITPRNSTSEVGVDIGFAKELAVNLSNIPKQVDLLAWFRTPNGPHVSALLSSSGDLRTLEFPQQIPPHSLLVAFEFRESSDYLSRRLHAMGEGSFAVPMLKGKGSILSVALDGKDQGLPNSLWGSKNFSYAFNGGSLYIRPKTVIGVPSVIVDPLTASLATNRLLTLTGSGQSYFQVRIGAVAPSFPSVGDRFVIMNLEQLQAEFAQSDLGSIDPIELWLSTPNSDAYLKKLDASSLQGLLVQARSKLERELRSDPTNVGLNGTYRLSLLFSLLLAIFMYATSLPLLYREGAGILFQLEASGVGPRRLRRSLRASLRFTVLTGLLLGSAIGILIGHFFISESTPYALIATSLVIAMALSEVGGLLFTKGFFTESTMVGGR